MPITFVTAFATAFATTLADVPAWATDVKGAEGVTVHEVSRMCKVSKRCRFDGGKSAECVRGSTIIRLADFFELASVPILGPWGGQTWIPRLTKLIRGPFYFFRENHSCALLKSEGLDFFALFLWPTWGPPGG